MVNKQKMRKTIFVYGSCLARDSAEVLLNRGWSLSHYTARQSLISAGTEVPIELLALPKPSNIFNSRIIRDDSAGSLYSDLRKYGIDSNAILWDIIPERLGVFRMKNGDFVTRTLEKLQIGGHGWCPPTSSLIDFGTDEHFQLWNSRLKEFVEFLKKEDFYGKTYLISCLWSDADRRNMPVPAPAHGPGATVANLLYSRYYEAIYELFPENILLVPPDITIADGDHKWGPAVFHYENKVYDWIADQVESRTV